MDLHYHDLRREFGSRLIGTPGVHPELVRDWLGHANITTTSRYVQTSAHGVFEAPRKFEASRGGICTRFAYRGYSGRHPGNGS